MNTNHSRAVSSEGYVLAWSGDRSVLNTHRENSNSNSLLKDYHNAGASRHKKTHSQMQFNSGWDNSIAHSINQLKNAWKVNKKSNNNSKRNVVNLPTLQK